MIVGHLGDVPLPRQR